MGKAYPYSGNQSHPESSWDPEIYKIMKQVNQDFNCHFNSCLVNYYENGSEYISPHSDDERGLDTQGQVVSISLGAERHLIIRDKRMLEDCIEIPLSPGSLFMMEGKNFQKIVRY